VSLVTVSKVRNRVYHRQFDHEECARLRAEDPERWTYPELAAHFGVSVVGIQRILNPRLRERMQEHVNAYARRQRRPCLGGCGTLVWMHGGKSRSGYCLRCVSALIAAPNVRETELRCLKCGEWKPDDQFYRRTSNHARRGRVTHCKPCAAVDRADHRRRNHDQEMIYQRHYYRTRRREKKKMAQFIVLKPRDGGYDTVGTVDAASSDHAIEKLAEEPGLYVATPTTKFREVTVAARTTLQVVDE
jgi:hypothetical protein